MKKELLSFLALELCPFCGGEATLIKKSDGWKCSKPVKITNSYAAGCNNCCIYTKPYQSSIWQDKDGTVHIDANGATDAIEAWNRRVINHDC